MFLDPCAMAAPGWPQPLAAWDGLIFWLIGIAGVMALGIWWWRRQADPLGRLEAVPLEREQLPRDVRAFFDSYDEPLSEQGFYPCGDYQTVHGRKPNYARFYACALADTYVEVDVYRKMDTGLVGSRDFRGLVCTSVFADGTSLQTGDFELPDGGAHAPPQLIYRGRPGLSLQELIAAHREDAEQCATEHGPVLQYPPGQLARVSVYYTQHQREYFVNPRRIPPPAGYEQTQEAMDEQELSLAQEVHPVPDVVQAQELREEVDVACS